MANAAMEARRSGMEFVFIVLGIFHFHAVFRVRSDEAFQGRVRSLHRLQDVFSGKVAGFFQFLFRCSTSDDLKPAKETSRLLILATLPSSIPASKNSIPRVGTQGTARFCATAP